MDAAQFAASFAILASPLMECLQLAFSARKRTYRNGSQSFHFGRMIRGYDENLPGEPIEDFDARNYKSLFETNVDVAQIVMY